MRYGTAGWRPFAALTVVVAVAGGVWLMWQPDRAAPAPRAARAKRPVIEWQRPESVVEDYVGSKACAECHEGIYKTYQEHPMAHSAADVAEGSPIERFGGQSSFAGGAHISYRAERTTTGVLRHSERRTDETGAELFEQQVDVKYAVGSGQRGRSYLIDRGGVLFLSPISWYSSKSRWDVSPGYSQNGQPRFERRVGDRCLVCHVGRMNPAANLQDAYGEPRFFELSVGCENCHGSGGRHVALRRAGQADDNSIVHPGKLDTDRRDAICYRCHLQGEGIFPRYGRRYDDFRPGERLDDVLMVFVRDPRVDRKGMTKAVSHVEQMRASKCFANSDGKLRCTSCHDPHSVPATAKAAVYFNSKCMVCHQNESCALSENKRGAEHNSCIACHMPKLEANDVPHAAQTDHRIVRRRASTETVQPSHDVVLFNNAESRVPAHEVARARGLLLTEWANNAGDLSLAAEAAELLAGVAADDWPALEALASDYVLRYRHAEAIQLLQAVLHQNPNREPALRLLAFLHHDRGETKLARTYLERLIEINPWHAQFFGRLTYTLGRLGELEGGIRAAKKGLELDPTLAPLHGWLADIYQKLGDEPESRRHQELLRRMVPPPK